MNIWIVNHYAYAPSHFAGTRHYQLAQQLRAKGHRPLIVSTSFFHKACQETRLDTDEQWRREEIDGVPFLWLRTPPYKGNTFARLWNMLAFARRVRRGDGLAAEAPPDVVWGSSPDLFAARAAHGLAKSWKVPFVLEIRDLWPETFVSLGHMGHLHPLVLEMRRIERHLYREADQIITLLPDAAEYITERGGNRGKIHWVPNGIDLDMVGAMQPPVAQTPFVVMFAGSHGAANGLDLILDAAKLLQNEPIVFRLVGDGREKPRLQRRAKDEGLTNIEFLDPVPKHQIYKVLESADAFLMILENSPVFQWGISPNKLFDYLACGRPILFSVPTTANPVEAAGAGFTVSPGDARQLAEAVQRMVATPLAERTAMGRRGRMYVEKNHTFSALADNLERILLTAIHEKAAPASDSVRRSA